MSYHPDADDVPVISYGLRNPYRYAIIDTRGADPIEITELHAFLWVQRFYLKSRSKRVRAHCRRIFNEWLDVAEFKRGVAH